MNSTLIRTATPATTCAPAVVDALVLPAAAAAPSVLVIAVEMWLMRETSALSGLVAGATGDVAAAHAVSSATKPSAVYGPAFRTRNSNDVQGSPPRGTPV